MILVFQNRRNGELREQRVNFYLAQVMILIAWLEGWDLLLDPMEFTVYRYFTGRPSI